MSELRFRIVAFVSANLSEATDLWVEAWARTMPDLDFQARRAWFVAHIAQMRDRGAEFICAFDADDGHMAGFITHEKPGQIDQFAVAARDWGSGAAAALLDEAKRLSAGGSLMLDVNQDNPRAVRFYEREGFNRVGEGRNQSSGLATWRYEWVDISRVG